MFFGPVLNNSNWSAIYSSKYSLSNLSWLILVYVSAEFLNFCNSDARLLPSFLRLALCSFLAILWYLACSCGVSIILYTPWKASWYLNGLFAPVYIVPETSSPPAISFMFKTNDPTRVPVVIKLLLSVAISAIPI